MHDKEVDDRKAELEAELLLLNMPHSLTLDVLTIQDVVKLRKDVNRPGLTILEWKRLVKAFAARHGAPDQEAIAIAKAVYDG